MAAIISMAMGIQAAHGQDAGQFGIRLLDAPVERSDDPRAQVFIVDHLGPSAVIERRVEVFNHTARELRIDLYASAAQIVDGTWTPLAGREPNELTSWIEIFPSALVLGPGMRDEAAVRIELPEDPPNEEQYAVVWAEAPPGGDGGVTVVNRVGVRVYLSTGRGAEPPSDFDVHSLRALRDERGVPRVEATVENTGERALDLSGELFLTDGPAGLTAGPFPTQGFTTLGPGDDGSLFVDLDNQVPAGPWLARMTVRSGTLVKAVEATIVFPDVAGESSPPVEATEVPLFRDRGFLLPLAVALVILLLILLGLAWWFFVVKRRRDDDDDQQSRGRKAKVGG